MGMMIQTTTDRVIKQISYSEGRIIEALAEQLAGQKAGIIVISAIAEQARLSRSVAVNVLSKLNAAGVLETRSLGMKGVAVTVRNQEAFAEIVKAVSAEE